VSKGEALQAMIQRARDVYPGKNVVCIPVFDWCNDYAELFYSLMDQPDRRGASYTVLGSGRFSPRWGVSCNYNVIAKYLSSCSLCHERNDILAEYPAGTVESMDGIICNECLNWNEFADSEMARFFSPPNYPQELLPTNKMLKAKFVECKELTSDVKLSVNTVNRKAATKIVDRAENCSLYNDLSSKHYDYPAEMKLYQG
jgi:hypothetical protein